MKKIFCFIAATLVLSACDNNPLKSHTKKQNVAFLRQAAIHAEQRMNLVSRKGRLYRYCMEENPEQIDCEGLFKNMLEFAQTSTEYRKLTYGELTNPKMYAAIAESYQSSIFNSLDD